MTRTIVITGASSGFGALSARALADAGHVVYAGMRDIDGHNATQVAEAKQYAAGHDVDLRPVELDVSSQRSADEAVGTVISEQGSIDVLLHNAGQMVTGPIEAFTPEQIADTRGGTPPYLGPYFAAKAGMDALAVSYAAELSCFDIETTIIVPGSFTKGTNHFAHSGHPADDEVVAEYDAAYPNLMADVSQRLAEQAPPDADVADVAAAVVHVVEMRHGTRPFRVHIDPADDGAAVVNGVADRIRAEFLTRIGLQDLLRPHATHAPEVSRR